MQVVELTDLIFFDRLFFGDKLLDQPGIAYQIAGAMSTLTVDVEGTGKPYKANFSLQGKIDGVSELTGALPVYDDDSALGTIADKFFNVTITVTNLETLDANTFCVNSLYLAIY